MKTLEIKKSSGETINAELISFFELTNINKKYVFYTMNEVVETDLIKMYVTEVVINEQGLQFAPKMTEEEWTNLKGVMKSILTGTRDPNVKYLEIEGE